MNPATVSAAVQIILAGLEIYRRERGLPDDWEPGPQDWEGMRTWAKRTPEQIKAEAKARLEKP